MSVVAKDLNGYGTIPGHWDVAALPDAVFFQEGPGLRKWQWTESGIKVINVTNILGDGRIDTNNTSRFISNEEYEKTYRHFTVDAGDIVVASSGNTYGKVGRISAKDLPLMMNTSVIRFRSSDRTKLDDDFLYAFLRSEVFSNQVESFVIGSAQPNFGPTHLKRMVMPLPPLPVQQRIAAILSAYDELIENSQRRIKILESMARTLYREWFVHFRFPGHENHPRVASPLGEIPQGWEVKKLGEIAEDMRRNVSKGQLEYPAPFVGLEHIPRRSLALDAWETTTELGSNKLEFKKGEVLFGKIRPYFHKVSVAPFDGLCSADTIVIRSRRPEHYAIVVGCVSSDEFVALATATSNGSKMPRANWSVLQEHPIAIPTLSVAGQFSAVVDPAIQQMQALIFQVQNLRRTRDLLLPRLLSGQIDVSNLSEPVAA